MLEWHKEPTHVVSQAYLKLSLKDGATGKSSYWVFRHERHIEDGEVKRRQCELRKEETRVQIVSLTLNYRWDVAVCERSVATHRAVERLLLRSIVAQRRSVSRLNAAQIQLAELVIEPRAEYINLERQSGFEWWCKVSEVHSRASSQRRQPFGGKSAHTYVERVVVAESKQHTVARRHLNRAKVELASKYLGPMQNNLFKAYIELSS